MLLVGMTGDYSPFKIILASICYDNFNDSKAKEILMNSLNIKNGERLNLLTLQMLTYQKNKQEFVPTVKQLLSQKNITPDLNEGLELFMYTTTGAPLVYKSFW